MPDGVFHLLPAFSFLPHGSQNRDPRARGIHRFVATGPSGRPKGAADRPERCAHDVDRDDPTRPEADGADLALLSIRVS
jgi:hypothetical protein